MITIYHTNVISVRLVWRERGTAFYAMNYVKGKELLSPNQKGWLAKSWAEVEPIAFALLGALEAVLDVQLIHGDVKPGNILLTSKGDPVLIVRVYNAKKLKTWDHAKSGRFSGNIKRKYTCLHARIRSAGTS